jgi:GNAT superfamily N-acetyltransferase
MPRAARAIADTTERVTLFCDTALARRIELAEAELIARSSEAARRRARPAAPADLAGPANLAGPTDLAGPIGPAGFVIPIAGGIASFAEIGSPFNKVAGLGFADGLDASSLDQIEQAYAAHGANVQVELSHLADPAIGARLTGRGYRLESFENVLGRALTGEVERVMPPGLEVGLSGEDEFDIWVIAVADGVAHPDTQGVPEHEEFTPEAVIAAERDQVEAGVVRYAARRDGIVVGGASMRITNGVAQLTGAATVPAHRRQGAQTALLSARLADAASAGCDVAVITTQPGSKSQQNAQRQGFDLLYTRAILVKKVML